MDKQRGRYSVGSLQVATGDGNFRNLAKRDKIGSPSEVSLRRAWPRKAEKVALLIIV